MIEPIHRKTMDGSRSINPKIVHAINSYIFCFSFCTDDHRQVAHYAATGEARPFRSDLMFIVTRLPVPEDLGTIVRPDRKSDKFATRIFYVFYGVRVIVEPSVLRPA